ncbi:MAG: ABC transporter permease subunit, partial [Candidatus Bipolaricaulota bacterium]|nr:ABC transporter permease subunit [Candidatus Bipolaricaulota bacterium]MDW8127422.1 ABC transporter permease subunit [Candidatus Bipolaricaulota bacterium]
MLSLLDAVILYFLVLLAWEKSWLFVGVIAAGLLGLNILAFYRRLYPFRYLAPGLLFMILMVVLPLLYTVYISFTNYATGNILTKAQVIEILTKRYFLPPNAPTFSFRAYGSKDSLYALHLFGPAGEYVVFPDGTLSPLEAHQVQDTDGDGIPEVLDGQPLLSTAELARFLQDLQKLEVPFDQGIIRLTTLSTMRVYSPQYAYDSTRDVLTDLRTGKEYKAQGGNFVSSDGDKLDPGWVAYVGFANYIKFIKDPLYHRAFVRVFLWTLIWAVLTVTLSFVLGLGLAILLNDKSLRFRRLYRSLLIIPYAIPAFISILIWRGFFNTEVGLFNRVLSQAFGTRVPWLSTPFWARFACIVTNVWLTYPYMMLVSLGALQSIPEEMYEAAKVDGATGWRRFVHITFPLLLISVAPLLIGSFAFTFNNFTLIWLLTRGEPVVEIGSRAG